jgi:hypothetical protein
VADRSRVPRQQGPVGDRRPSNYLATNLCDLARVSEEKDHRSPDASSDANDARVRAARCCRRCWTASVGRASCWLSGASWETFSGNASFLVRLSSACSSSGVSAASRAVDRVRVLDTSLNLNRLLRLAVPDL